MGELGFGSFVAAVVFGFGAGLGWALINGLIGLLKRSP